MALYSDHRVHVVEPGEPLLIIDVGEHWQPTILFLHLLVRGMELAAAIDSKDIVPLEEWMLR
jgi:hypothetical protein